MSFDSNTGIISGTPTNDEVGSHQFKIRSTDTLGEYTDQSYQLLVINTNDPPIINSEPLTDIMTGDKYSYKLEASDVDLNDILSYGSIDLPDWLNLDTESGLLEGQADTLDPISNNLKLIVSDKEGEVAQQNFLLAVGQYLSGT